MKLKDSLEEILIRINLLYKINLLLSSKAVNHRIPLRESTQYVIPKYTKVTDGKKVSALEQRVYAEL